MLVLQQIYTKAGFIQLCKHWPNLNDYPAAMVAAVMEAFGEAAYGRYSLNQLRPAVARLDDPVLTIWEAGTIAQIERIMIDIQHPLFMFYELAKHEDDGSNQFFYNTEKLKREHTGDDKHHLEGLAVRTPQLVDERRENVTPQNRIDDIENYLTGYAKDTTSGKDTNTTDDARTDDTHYIQTEDNVKSTLGDITVQFKNFIDFPSMLVRFLNGLSVRFSAEPFDLDGKTRKGIQRYASKGY